MKNAKLFLSTLVLTGVLATNVSAVEANYGQYGQVTGEQPGNNIDIDKKVAAPGTATQKGGVQAGKYFDNLTGSDQRFNPGDKVVFKLVVKNTSNKTLKNITVTDTLPAYMEPLVGPGTYDKDKRTITYTIAELQPGKEDVRYLETQIFTVGKLPADKGIIEFVNVAAAKADGAYDEDNAKYYAAKEVIGVTSVPKTGPALGLAFLALQGTGLAAGIYLVRRKA
jgi:uncharacterized repeat protein (TIGR01451 family)